MGVCTLSKTLGAEEGEGEKRESKKGESKKGEHVSKIEKKTHHKETLYPLKWICSNTRIDYIIIMRNVLQL